MNERMLKIELYKVSREIKVNGMQYTIYRDKTDEYGERTKEEPEEIGKIKGLFHLTKGYVTESISDGTRTYSKGQPKLMVRYDETENIKNGDFLMINGNRYNVIEKNNIQEYNIVSDISMELVLNGRN